MQWVNSSPCNNINPEGSFESHIHLLGIKNKTTLRNSRETSLGRQVGSDWEREQAWFGCCCDLNVVSYDIHIS